MKLLLLDFETTGKDPLTARPIQFCFKAWDSETEGAFYREGLLYAPDYPVLEQEIVDLTRIKHDDLVALGMNPRTVWEQLAESMGAFDFLVAHNAHSYDKVVMYTEAKRQGVELPDAKWIDTRIDPPYPQKMNCRKLSHLALDHGLVFDFSELHGAKADVELMHQLLLKYDLNEVAKIASSPSLYIQINTNYDSRDKAKARGFKWQQWEDNGPKFEKAWIKKIRDFQYDLEAQEAAKLGHKIRKLTDA